MRARICFQVLCRAFGIGSLFAISLFAIGCGGGQHQVGGPPIVHLDGGASDGAAHANPDLATGPHGSPDMAMAHQGPCDPIGQDCGNNAKCTYVDDGSGSGAVTQQCVPPTGMKMVGQACMRVADNASGVGHDDCAAGTFCSGIGSLMSPPSRHCRKFCLADGDCGAKESCNSLTRMPDIGLCIPQCTPFGNDCPNGLKCDLAQLDNDQMSVAFSCRQPGKIGLGQACMTSIDCVANAICSDPMKTGPTCIPLCDQNHPCGGGRQCAPFSMAASIGICQ